MEQPTTVAKSPDTEAAKMDQPAEVGQAPETTAVKTDQQPAVPLSPRTLAAKLDQPGEYYGFIDLTSETPESVDNYKILVDSDEGRAYAELSTDAERLQHMRLYAHEKSAIVQAQWHFYRDKKEGKEYFIHINTPESEEVETLMGDSDEEWEEDSERAELVLRYFREHAHKVEVLQKNAEVLQKNSEGKGLIDYDSGIRCEK